MALHESVLSIVSDTAVELGLGTVSAVYASTDANVVQLRTLLKRLGRDLALEHEWKQLTKEHTFTTTSATSYSLPADFSRMLANSSWNRSSNTRAVPVGAQVWQYLKALDSTTTWTVYFRPTQLTLTVHPDPPTSGETIAFEYQSRYWVATTGTTTPAKDAPTVDTDVVLFDSTLMVAALKLAWLRAKGMDATAAADDFVRTLERVRSADASAAPVLRLDGEPLDEKFLSERNAPDTGFGLDGFGGLF